MWLEESEQEGWRETKAKGQQSGQVLWTFSQGAQGRKWRLVNRRLDQFHLCFRRIILANV